MARKTRKQKKHTIYLEYLPKMRGGRSTNLTTFRPACTKEGAHVRIKGLRTLKSPTDSDEYVHVALSSFDHKEIIVKLQDTGPMLQRELEIHSILSAHPNVVSYVCHFPCLFDSVIWNTPLTRPASVCDLSGGTQHHMILMEYINNDVSTFLEESTYTSEILTSIIQQVVFALLDFHMNYGISHNDINRGNLLLQQEDAKEIVYTVGSLTHTVRTHGYTCVYIDFQRGNLLEKKDIDIWLELAVDEITLALYLLGKWVRRQEDKAKIQGLLEGVIHARSLEEVWTACKN